MIRHKDSMWALLPLIYFTLTSFVSNAVHSQEPGHKPKIFVCGDSTAKNSGKDKNGKELAGWGTPIADFFDPQKAVVKNVGHAGRSSRTYFEGDWPTVLPQINQGDYLLLVFGINDGSTPPGLGDETMERNGKEVHTYGWYMSKMATEARGRGATVVLLTVTTRNIWTNPKVQFADAKPVGDLPSDYDSSQDKIERGTGNGRFTQWTKDVGVKLNLPVFDLTNYCADRYEVMGREQVDAYYSDHNHTYLAGAKFIAAAIVAGLKALPESPFISLLSERGNAIAAADEKYVIAPKQSASKNESVDIADVPRHTQMGPFPAPEGAPGDGRYSPPVPADPRLPTLWIIGDSTVRNGTLGEGPITAQWGWGAPIVVYFDMQKINVVNRAFGGTSSRTFYSGFFWKNLKPQIKAGDFVLMQFGANDNGGASGKGALRGIGNETEDVVKNGQTETVHTFGWYLRQFVTETREQGGTPIICSLTPRKSWTDVGVFQRDRSTHVAWAEQVATETDTAYIDLYERIARKFESLGREQVDKLFVPTPTERLHSGWDGAVMNAQCVIAGLKSLKGSPLNAFFAPRAQAISFEENAIHSDR